MRNIPRFDFWKAVFESIGEQRYSEILSVMRDAVKNAYTSEKALRDMYARMLPIMLDAVRLNGCRREESERAYQSQTRDAFLEIAKKYPILVSCTDPAQHDEFKRIMYEVVVPRFEEIRERFLADKCCHTHLIDGFTCYCDEIRIN